MLQQAKCEQQHSNNNNCSCEELCWAKCSDNNNADLGKDHARTCRDHDQFRASSPATPLEQQQQQHTEPLPGIAETAVSVAAKKSPGFVAQPVVAGEISEDSEAVPSVASGKCPNFRVTKADIVHNNGENCNNACKGETKNNNNATTTTSTQQIIKILMASHIVAVNMLPPPPVPTATERSAQIEILTPPPRTTTVATATAAAAAAITTAAAVAIKTTTSTKKSSGNMLPAPQQRNTEKTKDFNSRRRRGRLRPATAATPNVASGSPGGLLSSSSSDSSSSPPSLSLLLLLFSFAIDYYVYITNLVLSTIITSCRLRHRRSQPASSYATVIAAGAKHAAVAAIAASIETATTATATTTKTPKQTPAECKTTTTIIKEKCSGCGGGSRMPLIYVFVLCTSILLPGSNNLAVAAKPKSATQLQQHKAHQHDQQQQQQSPAQPQHVAGVSFDGNGVGVLTPPSYQVVSGQASNEDTDFMYSSGEIFDSEQALEGLNEADDDANAAYETQRNDTHNDHANVTKSPLFPKDLFTKEQLENGAVVFHIIGVIYMFVALAIVCDEFFVPSLDVIIEKLDITDDVAGATFMAAGGSAPELFTSVIGVFISFDDVGIGTIVGSAVFNILFVIGMCALFSRTILTLTWWPLFRDCTFYSISLLVLIYFFRDNFIYWWEALILFLIYIAYVTFMKWNVQVERCVKKLITKNKVTRVRSTDQLMPAGNAANSSETSMATQPGGSVTSRAASESRSGPPGSSSGAGATGNSSGTAGSTQTGAKFRHGLLQLMIHTIDPLHDDDVPGKVDEKATQLHAIASLKVLLDATKPQRGGATTSAANHVKINLKETTLADRPNGNIDTTLDSPSLSGRRPSWIEQRVKIQTRKFSIKTNEVEDEPEPLSMAWPDTARKRLTYVLVAPLLIPMWLTLPDTRTPRGKKYFPVTFIGSIVWIAIFSYLMVWWANVAGDTAGINPEVMGLTFLAAGTSIPDLITSVIVARKGFGDMAVSSSVGSNIFDVTVGLPIPWLLFGIIYGAPVEVNSVGMVCSITILFMMLIFVVMSIACFHWRMNKGLGFTMFLLYFVFVAVSLMFEYHYIDCPV